MKPRNLKLGRRQLAAASGASLMFGGALCARAQQKVAPITIVINQSPSAGMRSPSP